jgi:hypothetical protein
VLQVYGARSPSAQVSKKRVTPVNARGSVVPGKKVKCEKVCGESEQQVDPVSGAEILQIDQPRVKEIAESGRSSSENVSGWVDHASHGYAQSMQEQEVPATSQTKPYADPCKHGEEKAEDDHRRPLALILLSSVSSVKIASGGDQRSIAITPVKEIAREARCLAYL